MLELSSKETADPLERLMELAAASVADRIMIVGAGRLDMMLALCRRGYARVACHADKAGPHGADGYADVLVAPDLAPDGDFGRTLAAFDSALRPGGRLVIRHRGDGRTTAALCRLLAAHGFDPVPGAGRLAGLLCARKGRISAPALAAA